jgi:dTDP-4-amino-4,6-dideoxygalactose transaminase
VTHLYGAAANILEITSWAHGLGILVLEDCAQALGAWDGEHRVGSVGNIATTSFYPTKNLGALGDGGALMTNDETLATRVRRLRQYGWSSKYETDTPGGTNSRLDELQAAILRRRLLNLDATNQRRQEIHSRYQKAAADSVRFVNSSSAGFVGHLAVIEVDSRDKVRAHFDSLGISTAVHYPMPDHRQAIALSTAAVWSLPNTEAIANRVLSLPLFAELTEEEICRVEAALASVPSF